MLFFLITIMFYEFSDSWLNLLQNIDKKKAKRTKDFNFFFFFWGGGGVV